jgi:lipoate-protein ligase A
MTSRPTLLKYIDSPERALDSERDLLARVVSGECDTALSFWSTQQSIVVPRRLSKNSVFDSASRLSQLRGWPVTLRESGGDATPQGGGVINVTYAHVCDQHPPIADSYRKLCAPIVRLVEGFGQSGICRSVSGSFCDGDYNVVCHQRKLAGTAQRRSRRRGRGSSAVLFAHALILVNADIVGSVDAINRFYEDCDQPASIDAGAHINLAEIAETGEPLDAEDVVKLLQRDYRALLANPH